VLNLGLLGLHCLRGQPNERELVELFVTLVREVTVPALHVFVENLEELIACVDVLLLEQDHGFLSVHELDQLFDGCFEEDAEVPDVAQLAAEFDRILNAR